MLIELTLLAITIIALYFLRKERSCKIYVREDSFLKKLIGKCSLIQKGFQPCLFLPNRTAQTLVAALFRFFPTVQYDREFVPTEDGGEVALDWEIGGLELEASTPTVLILHGLVGCSESYYVVFLIDVLRKKGWRCAVLNARGCGGSVLKTPEPFCASRTEDLRETVKHIKKRFPTSPLLGVGFSMGANMVASYLGEEGVHSPIEAAVCISNPFDLSCNIGKKPNLADSLFNPILVKSLTKYAMKHKEILGSKVDEEALKKAKSVAEFDEIFFAKLFGYPSIEEFYRDGASANKIKGIGVPTLFVNAEDDPAAPGHVIPRHLSKVNDNICFAVTKEGGHLAHLEDAFWRECWSDRVTSEYFSICLSSDKR